MSLGGGAWYLGAFLLAVSILVVFHELGHYLAAKGCGVKVLRFSVGFGPVLYRRARGPDRTEWAISALPLGGYVKMLDEREGEVPAAELHRAFNRQTVGKRALIVVAGPLANLLLAILLYWVMYMAGIQELRPLLDEPATGTPAAMAGIAARDQVIALDGDPILTWGDLRMALVDAAGVRGQVELTVLDDRGATQTRIMALPELDLDNQENDPLATLGLGLYRHRLPAVIAQVLADSPAAVAGIQAGDEVMSIDEVPVQDWNTLQKAISAAPGKTLRMALKQAGGMREIQVTPREEVHHGRLVGRIGIAPPPVPESYVVLTEMRLGPLDALFRAVTQTWSTARLSVVMMGRMVAGRLSWKNLSGPVTIADYAGQSAKMGMASYLRFLALISISLAVLNLLPIPVLDGGHLMYYLAETIKGSPVSERTLEIGQRIGISIFVVLTIFALFNDFNRLLSG